MIQYPLHGSYSPSQLVMVGAFKTVTSGNPTVLRDGTKVSASQKMFSVTRESAGLYTVTFAKGFPIPALPFILVSLAQAAAPTADATVHVVRNSWNTSTRSFQIQLQTNAGTPAASDGDAGDVVSFLLVGAIDSVGVDPA